MNITADLAHLIRTTSDTLEEGLRAAIDGDVHHARQVLKGSADRRRLVTFVSDAMRERDWVPAPQLNARLQFVSDIGRVGDLVDQLARHIISAHGTPSLSPAQRMEVAVLLDAGGRRLRQLADGPVGPAMDPSYRGCGSALFEVADHGGRDSSAVVSLCGALAVVLLQASRHANRAA